MILSASCPYNRFWAVSIFIVIESLWLSCGCRFLKSCIRTNIERGLFTSEILRFCPLARFFFNESVLNIYLKFYLFKYFKYLFEVYLNICLTEVFKYLLGHLLWILVQNIFAFNYRIFMMRMYVKLILFSLIGEWGTVEFF